MDITETDWILIAQLDHVRQILWTIFAWVRQNNISQTITITWRRKKSRRLEDRWTAWTFCMQHVSRFTELDAFVKNIDSQRWMCLWRNVKFRTSMLCYKQTSGERRSEIHFIEKMTLPFYVDYVAPFERKQ